MPNISLDQVINANSEMYKITEYPNAMCIKDNTETSFRIDIKLTPSKQSATKEFRGKHLFFLLAETSKANATLWSGILRFLLESNVTHITISKHMQPKIEGISIWDDDAERESFGYQFMVSCTNFNSAQVKAIYQLLNDLLKGKSGLNLIVNKVPHNHVLIPSSEYIYCRKADKAIFLNALELSAPSLPATAPTTSTILTQLPQPLQTPTPVEVAPEVEIAVTKPEPATLTSQQQSILTAINILLNSLPKPEQIPVLEELNKLHLTEASTEMESIRKAGRQ
jgi:hypothetical protein